MIKAPKNTPKMLLKKVSSGWKKASNGAIAAIGKLITSGIIKSFKSINEQTIRAEKKTTV